MAQIKTFLPERIKNVLFKFKTFVEAEHNMSDSDYAYLLHMYIFIFFYSEESFLLLLASESTNHLLDCFRFKALEQPLHLILQKQVHSVNEKKEHTTTTTYFANERAVSGF